MIPPLYRSIGLSFLILSSACRARPEPVDAARDSSTVHQREARLESALARTDSGSEAPLARWILPTALSEISGLALTTDGRLLAHNDEAGRVFELDYRRGMIVKSFWIGTQTIGGDFEAITVSGDRIFLLSSDGRIFEFKEGADGARVPYQLHETQLGGECEFEGLTFDPAANALVLACKHTHLKSLHDHVVLFKYSLTDTSETGVTQLKIPERRIIGENQWKHFTPSDITVDPTSGDYILVASQEKAIARITPAGEVVWSRPLPAGHDMAEGVAITKDGMLIVSDEAVSKATPAAVTLYRWHGINETPVGTRP